MDPIKACSASIFEGSLFSIEFFDLRLGQIGVLRDEFPGLTIGLSDHFNGILSGPVGFLEGARIFEKHVTLNRAWKGSDHAFALEPEGYSKFVRDTTRVNQMLFGGDEALLGSEEIFARLGKSDEVANVALFLASNLSSYINGQTIRVDGGM